MVMIDNSDGLFNNLPRLTGKQLKMRATSFSTMLSKEEKVEQKIATIEQKQAKLDQEL